MPIVCPHEGCGYALEKEVLDKHIKNYPFKSLADTVGRELHLSTSRYVVSVFTSNYNHYNHKCINKHECASHKSYLLMWEFYILFLACKIPAGWVIQLQ